MENCIDHQQGSHDSILRALGRSPLERKAQRSDKSLLFSHKLSLLFTREPKDRISSHISTLPVCVLSEASGVGLGEGVMLYLAQEFKCGRVGGISCKDEEEKLQFMVTQWSGGLKHFLYLQDLPQHSHGLDVLGLFWGGGQNPQDPEWIRKTLGSQCWGRVCRVWISVGVHSSRLGSKDG